jgi:DoxX-like protein
MKKSNAPVSKTRKVIYWIATLWLSSGMLATGILQLTKTEAQGSVSPPGVEGIKHLGYPVYFLTILGLWKILGVIAVLIPKYPLLKEWAYAGFFFIMSGAIFSHIAVNDSAKELFPSALLLAMTVISWYLRPANRRMASIEAEQARRVKREEDKRGELIATA